jgi:hypothetical protein
MSRHLHHTRGIWAGRDELEGGAIEVVHRSKSSSRSSTTQAAASTRAVGGTASSASR